MKEYMIVPFYGEYSVHKRVGEGNCYLMVFCGNIEELGKYLKDNNITDYGYGF